MAYMGFKAVEASAAAGGARNPAAVAASIGRKKYGKAKFQKAAAAGKKMKGEEPVKKSKKKKKKAKPAGRGGIAQDIFARDSDSDYA